MGFDKPQPLPVSARGVVFVEVTVEVRFSTPLKFQSEPAEPVDLGGASHESRRSLSLEPHPLLSFLSFGFGGGWKEAQYVNDESIE